MTDGKIIVARLWSRYEGGVPSRAPIMLGIDPKKYQTIFIYLMKDSEVPNFFEEKGLKVFYISKKRALRMYNLWVIYKLSRVLKREKVDILHCHRHKSTVYGTIAAALAGTPAVFAHVHGISRTKNWRRRLVNSVVLKRVNKILTVGEAVREDVLRDNPVVKPDQVVSIGNSIDYDRYANAGITKQQAKENIGLKADCFVFGTVARMAPNKGQICLIKAFEKVKNTLPSAHLVFVGDGRLRKELENAAAKTGFSDSIHFFGKRKDVPQMLRAMDAFVLPSIGSEGLPRVLLEAMAAGVPCIGTQVSGIPEIFDNGKFGVLVPPKDENALAKAMMEVANAPQRELQGLIIKAKDKVEQNYTHSIVVKKLETIYDVLV